MISYDVTILIDPLFVIRIVPEEEVFVGVGATEVMFAATQGILNPGDEVIVFEPSFDIYGAQVLIFVTIGNI